MRKDSLRRHLLAGGTLDQALEFGPGEECEIFKSHVFEASDEVLYIPDTVLNGVPVSSPVAGKEDIENVLALCYTGNDFLDICKGNLELAKRLFWSCTWQHPSSCLDDMDDDVEDEAC